uniref:Plexin-B1 n=1 Tax=Oryzias melastigma TaxID=30732 RepID=A0A3B3C2H0_ORYME
MLHGKALHSSQVFLLILAASCLANCHSYPRFSRNDTEFQHLVLHPDPLVERVYIGAKDHLFQLDGSGGLQLEQEETTGPVSDSKECLPPVTQLNCPQASRTSNHNKLLLVDPKAQELITCGSVHQGTCQKRSLASIREVLFSTERPVDTQYVAANDPSVSTVGLVVELEGGGRTVMYVGRGYTSSHPPISTRHLSSEPIFSYEDTAKLAVAGRLSEYDHHFVTAFTRRSYVYFLFYRRDIKSVSREYRTYAARACLEDSSYYSYVEIPLVCRSSSFPSRNYNLLQAAQVGQSGSLQGEDLLGVFSTRSSSTNGGLESSALCIFPLEELDRHIDSTRDLCYTQDGRVEGRGEVAYIEYEVKSSCANLPPNTLKAYPCGSDHTPSPMASRAPLEVRASWHTSAARLTAVAVSVSEGHSIAFLGDSKGNLHKVYLGKDGLVEVYEHTTVHPNSPISSDLLLDQNGSHIYIMTKSALEKRPVAECGDHLDCQSCLSARDPYCGWCVLEGIGARPVVVEFQPDAAVPQHPAPQLVAVSVDGLPSLKQGEAYSCFFQDTETPALLTTSGVICSTPDASTAVSDADFVMVTLSLRFINVTVAETEFTFFNCSLVQEVILCFSSARCHGCVSSRWGCNWCIHEHVCTHERSCSRGVTVYNRHVSENQKRTSSSFHPFPFPFPPQLYFSAPSPPAVLMAPTATPGGAMTTTPPPTETPAPTPAATTNTPPLPSKEESSTSYSSSRTSSCVRTSTQTSTLLSDVITTSAEVSDAEGATKGAGGSSEEQEPNISTVTDETRRTTLPSSTSTLQDVLSSSTISSTTASEAAPTTLPSNPPDEEAAPLSSQQEDTSPPWSNGRQETEGPECPCVEKLQDSSLLPVNVERKIRLVGQHLNLFQDDSMDYECVLDIENQSVVVEASVEQDVAQPSIFIITCLPHQVRNAHHEVFESKGLTLFNCSVGRSDCSRCRTADSKYGCVWCGGAGSSRCVFQDSCTDEIKHSCPAPVIHFLDPISGPVEGGTVVTISGSNLGQRAEDVQSSVTVAGVPCNVIFSRYEVSSRIVCETSSSEKERSGHASVGVRGGGLGLSTQMFSFQDPVLSSIKPERGPKAGGSSLTINGRSLRTGHPSEVSVLIGGVPCLVGSNRTGMHNITVRFGGAERHLQGDMYRYTANPNITEAKPSRSFLRGGRIIRVSGQNLDVVQEPKMRVTLSPPDRSLLRRWRRIVPEASCPEGALCHVKQVRDVTVVSIQTFSSYHSSVPSSPVRISLHGEQLLPHPVFSFQMCNFLLLQLSSVSTFLEPFMFFFCLVLACPALNVVFSSPSPVRRKSKQAMRDYKKVQIQLENLETSVRDRCKKEFTDLMTEMMDMSSDLVGSGIPFLDYRAYAERIFFPGHQESPLRRDLDIPESRRQTVEQGLVQLSNLLNSKLFLIKFIHTLEAQRTFSPRDRAYVASLLTVALHGKLEYFTDILKTLLNDLVEQYVAKNPKLMLRRTESVVEKLLTNWMSICLYTFLRESAGESFYMLFRAIKHQVDKGPVDAVTGKAKYTLNDNRLLREDVEYRTLTLNVVMPAADASGGSTAQTVPAKVLDCDTITQVKEKVLEQTWKGTSFSQRPHIDSLNLEWRAGVAGHLILSDEDLTSVLQGSWKRLNTLQHYKVPDGATVALVSRNSKHLLHDSHDYMPGEKTPMLDDGEEGGVRLWHLVKASEEPEMHKHRRGSMRERGGERAKAIPEIYLTRLLSMKGTLQKFVDDLFTAILSTSRPVPLAVKYFFDLLDEQAQQHSIPDPETIHIWKTNSLPLRFWINILKNPQFIFDVQTSDHVDAVLSVIAQTFMDSCTIADHKLGRDSPINKLLYARDIPRYKQMVERYYTDIRQTISASDQEMNSALAELSRNYAPEVNCLVALHELYKYINKYYDQIITALEEDCTAQKMQLGYRLQQIAAAVENKVTDL